MIKFLILHGYGDQILIAQDMCDQWKYTRFGGKNSGHVLRSIVPKMLNFGVSKTDVDKILVSNPARALAFK